MKIGIDIDDTLTSSTEKVREVIEEYKNEYSLEEQEILVNGVDEIIRGIFHEKLIEDFFKKHASQIGREADIKEDASEIIKKLRKEGHKIYFITARSDDYFGGTRKIIEDYFDKYDIEYDKLITAKTYKSGICKEEGIDIMFDDAVDTCESMKSVNIKGVVYTSELNKNRLTNCDRVSTWKELYNYVNNFCVKH